MNFAQRVTTPGVEAIYGRSRGWQPAQWDAEKIKESLGDDVQSRPWIDLYSLNVCGSNVPGIIQGPVMLVVLEEHVFRGEGDAWYLLLYQKTLGHEAPSSFVRNDACVRNDSESASASLSASLVFFERRSSSCRVIRAGILANCPNISKQKGALSPLEGFFFKDHQSEFPYVFLYP